MNIYSLIDTAIDIYVFIIIARSFLSFIPHDPYQPIFRFIYEITEPVLRPFRRFSVGGGGFGVDFSPLIVILLLQFVARPVIFSLLNLIWR